MTSLTSSFVGRAVAAAGDVKLDLSGINVFDPNKTGGYDLVGTITGIVFAFLAAAAFVGIVYSGFMMITAGGDASKMEAGKKNLIWSIIGIVVVILAYFIIKTIYSLTGEIIVRP